MVIAALNRKSLDGVIIARKELIYCNSLVLQLKTWVSCILSSLSIELIDLVTFVSGTCMKTDIWNLQTGYLYKIYYGELLLSTTEVTMPKANINIVCESLVPMAQSGV